MKKSIVAGLVFLNGIAMVAQSKDEQMLKDIYKAGLTNAKCVPLVGEPFTWGAQ